MPKSVGFWLYGAQPITTRPPVGRVRFVRWTRNGHGFLKNSKVGRIFIRSVSVGRVRFVRFVRWTRNGHGFLKNSKVGRILTVWGPAYYNPAASRPCPFCPLDTERTRIFEKFQSRSDFYPVGVGRPCPFCPFCPLDTERTRIFACPFRVQRTKRTRPTDLIQNCVSARADSSD